MKDEDWQRFSNMARFNIWGTDKEREEIHGILGVIILIGLACWGLYWLFTKIF
jgi:hypothetical protein